ncbi:MAG: hypothetical protein KAU50_02955 [Candidatus Marinimicrobia bacterium]|nr:hypothetical protein [Candidatus Neomarinimicrobiota bacterium]
MLLIAAYAVVLLLLDIGLTHLLNYIRPLYAGDVYMEHDIYHHDFRPNVEKDKSFRQRPYRVFTNSLGFKDQAIRSVDLDRGANRILFMGDSFTEGVAFNYKKTFVGIIDSALAHHGVEVLNAGVQSYSPIIYWKKTEYLLDSLRLQFDHMVLFLDIADAYNEANQYVLTTDNRVLEDKTLAESNDAVSRSTRIKRFVQNRTTVLYFATNYLYDLAFEKDRNNHWKKIIALPVSLWTIDNTIYDQWGHQGLHNMELYMNRLYVLLQGHGVRLTVAVYPWPSQVWHNDLESIQVKYWSNWCAERGVDFINYFPDFVSGTADAETKLATLKRYYLPYDMHFNERGNQLVAQRFLEYYATAH